MINLNNYLKRIEVNYHPQPTFDNLRLLMSQHLFNIPFENIDVLKGKYIKLDFECFSEKIIQNKQGGFCYELNGLFYLLLKELDFKVKLIAATVFNKDGEWAYPNSHAALLVNIDQPYLVDVGFGDSFLNPLPITGEIMEDESGKYRVNQVNSDYFLQKSFHDGWKTQYKFTVDNRELDYFIDACHFNQTSPDSIFTKGLIVTIPYQQGRATISSNSLTLKELQTTTKKVFKSKNQLIETIHQYANIPFEILAFLMEEPETNF